MRARVCKPVVESMPSAETVSIATAGAAATAASIDGLSAAFSESWMDSSANGCSTGSSTRAGGANASSNSSDDSTLMCSSIREASNCGIVVIGVAVEAPAEPASVADWREQAQARNLPRRPKRAHQRRR